MGLVVFTDLDGTLLDHDDYSWSAAAPALEALKAAGVPLVLCSSKTRAEMTRLHAELGLVDPLVVENGGGVFAPADHHMAAGEKWYDAGEGWRGLALGMGIDKVRQRLAKMAPRFDAQGFGQMSSAEIAGLTGLSEEKAALAKQREFNEPVVLPRPDEQADAFALAGAAHGLMVTRGGRFFHLLGGGDKGAAVKLISQWYEDRDPELKTMALGDALNDVTMLKAADRAVLVARHDGTHALVDMPGLIKQGQPGPKGWNEAVLAALKEVA